MTAPPPLILSSSLSSSSSPSSCPDAHPIPLPHLQYWTSHHWYLHTYAYTLAHAHKHALADPVAVRVRPTHGLTHTHTHTHTHSHPLTPSQVACAQVDTDNIVIKTIAKHQEAIVSVCSKMGFKSLEFAPFGANSAYLDWVSENVWEFSRSYDDNVGRVSSNKTCIVTVNARQQLGWGNIINVIKIYRDRTSRDIGCVS